MTARNYRGARFWYPTNPLVKKFTIEGHQFVCIDKPFGFSTCAADPLHPGMKEILEQQMQKELWRLEQFNDQNETEISGCHLFAEDPDSALWFQSLDASQSPQRKFCFLTDRSTPANNLVHSSHIEWIHNRAVSTSRPNPNCETRFEWAGPRGDYQLWWAYARTPLPGQIRAHARDCQIPILGDVANAGTPAIRVFIHSLTADFSNLANISGDINFSAPWWTHAALANDDSDVWREIFENQQRLFQADANATLHLPHPRDEKWQLEVMGEIAIFSKFTDAPMEEIERKCLTQWTTEFGKKAIIKTEPNRESSSSKAERQVFESANIPDSWIVNEGSLRFILKKNQGQSVGLFLDQRGNRDWVRRNSLGKRVLNLFAYTGGFSLAGALGGASEVTTVDVSANYLNWAKENFALNNLDANAHRFFAMDTFEFYKFATKKNLKYDLIVCDPPTFGRSKLGVFKIDRDFPNLINGALSLLNPRGQILFSTNFQKWDYSLWEKKLRSAFSNLQISRGPGFSLDFEKNLAERKMKSFLLKSIENS